MDINMDSILDASFGESSEEIRCAYKKTINIKQYESEVTELESVVKLNRPISGAERALICAILQAQLEYTAYCGLAYKGQITQSDMTNRKNDLELSVKAIKAKAESVLGKPLDNLFESIKAE